jgi:DNA-binding transcriptional LysR family regulator
MSKLPDLEGLAIFAKVAELRSFAGAAAELGLSKATVSKAVGRIEARLGARLFNRTSRRLALTDAGRNLAVPAARILAEGEAAETEARAQSSTPRGLVRLAVPMSFGLREVAPALPDFFAACPDVSVDLHLSDEVIDVIGGGFDAALRIAALPDYLARHGRPKHPRDLATHACLGYAYLPTREAWRFVNKAGEEVAVRVDGPLRANNADALMPALLAGQGLAIQPEFMIRDDLKAGRLVALLSDWHLPEIALHLVTPPGGPRPARIEALVEFLVKRFSRAGEMGKKVQRKVR